MREYRFWIARSRKGEIALYLDGLTGKWQPRLFMTRTDARRFSRLLNLTRVIPATLAFEAPEDRKHGEEKR